LTNREEPGGEPPSAAASAPAVDAARVKELRAARAQALADAQELSERLDHERTVAEKLARQHKQAAERSAAKVRALARQTFYNEHQSVPTTQWNKVEREVGRELDLALELRAVETRVQLFAESLTVQEARVQQLERALALAMAQARTLAWERAQARSPRLKAIAIARSIGRLLQGRSDLWESIVGSLYLGMRVVAVLVWMLPKADRARWKDESFSHLEDLKGEGAPLLGDAFRIAFRTPWLALVLWTGVWRRSPAARWLPRLKPLWIGLGTAAATFLGGAAGIGQSPTEFQIRALMGASLLTGALAVTGSYKGRRPRSRRRKR
jgi:hypothetical protein